MIINSQFRLQISTYVRSTLLVKNKEGGVPREQTVPHSNYFDDGPFIAYDDRFRT